MRVLYVTHASLVSGAERALLDQLDVLPATISPVVASPPGPLVDMLRARGIDVAEFPGASGGLRVRARESISAVRQLAASSRALQKIVAAVRPDVVHANSLRAGLIANAAKPFTRTPTIVHVHDALPQSTLATLVRLVLREGADAVIAISDYTADNFANGASRENIHVLHNPLDAELFDPVAKTKREARAELGIAADDKLIGLVAQITPWKDQELAIRSAALLQERHPGARLILVGEAKFLGPAVSYDNAAYLERLQRVVADLELERQVEFWGEQADVPTIMRGLDVLVAPSWVEPFGRSVIEAMAMEAAVVATSVGGPAEYIDDGLDGVLLPPRDVGLWTDAVAGLLDDPRRRELMGRRASPKVRNRFERRQYAEKVAEVYEEVTHGNRPALRTRGAHHRSSRRALGDPWLPPTRMRILFVEHTSVIGGGQLSLLELLRVLRDQHEVLLACPEGPLAEAAAALDVPVTLITESQLTFKLEPLGILRETARALRARRALKAQVDLVRPDVIHANSVRAGLVAVGFRHVVPVVVHCRDLLPPGPLTAAVRRVTLASSSMVVAVSEAVAVRLAGKPWAERRITVIDNPVDFERFDPGRFERGNTRHELGLDGGPVLGVIAQITPWKGQVRAVRVLDRIREAQPEAQLLIVGGTKFVSSVTRYDNRGYERLVRQTVEDLGLQHQVSFLGEREDVERIMAALDVVLVPSTEEPFGRSVVEALAMGLPVIATDKGGPAEVIRPDIDGVVLAPDDIVSWARAVASLSRRGFCMESRDYARERFSPERHATEVLSVYDRVVAASRARPTVAPASAGTLDPR